MNNQSRIIAYRQLIIEKLLPLIDSDYVLLDIPNHPNIGDNLIWEGELQFLKSIPHNCIYSSNIHNFKEDKIKQAKIILFHGGGNWGDLYRECQKFRLYIANKYKDKRIIVFPQTVCYKDQSLLTCDNVIFNQHPDIHICVRDKASYNLLYPDIDHNKLYLLPDMALFVDISHQYTNNLNNKILYMLRTDAEIDNTRIDLKSEYDIKDWPTFSSNKFILRLSTYFSYYKIKFSVILQNIRIVDKIISPIYGLNRRNNRLRYITKGIIFFSNYSVIYTTRLHGLILGVLMNKKIIIVDNKYNKCKNFYETWLTDFNNIELYK